MKREMEKTMKRTEGPGAMIVKTGPKWMALCLAVAALALSSPAVCTPGDCGERDGFPLVKGSFWVYQGKARWTQEGGAIVTRSPTVRMEVIDVLKRGHLTVAVMKGHPSDYEQEGPDEFSDHLVVRVGAATYFNIDGQRMQSILEKIRDPKEDLFGLLGEKEEPFLELPLVAGKIYGSPIQITREDRYYCWVVMKEEEVDLSGVKGLGPPGKRKQYTLRYFTLPGEVSLDFVPGVGITGYRYIHHGTIDEADLKLVEIGGGLR